MRTFLPPPNDPLLDGRRGLTQLPALLAAMLVAAHLALQTLALLSGHDHLLGLVPLFDLDREASVPTWFSSSLLLVDAGLFAAVARASPPAARLPALLLALLLLGCSLDEIAGLHETLGALVQRWLGARATGALHFPWVLPATLALLPGAGLLLPVGRRVPAALRRPLLLALLCYVAGALGVEMLGGSFAERHGTDSAGYRLLFVPFEEGLELFATVALFEIARRWLRQLSPAPGAIAATPVTPPRVPPAT